MWKGNISFVLVEPREAGNIGAAARAMKNMGFGNLCLVRPQSAMTAEARWMAHNAVDILESSETFDDVSDAVSDKALVVGTTRRLGKRRGTILPVDRGAQEICAFAQRNRVAILFGREDRGLFNEEVEECGLLLTIPASKDQASLNLSQAVMVVAYELSRAHYKRQESGDRTKDRESGNRIGGLDPIVKDSTIESISLINQGELKALYDRVSHALKLLGYLPRGDRDLEKKIMANLKRLLGRSGLTSWELKMLHGICSQIERKLGHES